MKSFRHLEEYSVMEINGLMDSLRRSYDIVQLVDVEECRVLEVKDDGSIHYGRECFRVWNRNMRCANCSGYQACMTHCATDKQEHMGGGRQLAHSIPIYLELLSGDLELCVLDCVKIITPNHESGGADESDDPNYISTHDVLTRLYTQEKLFYEVRRRLIDDTGHTYLIIMGNIRNFTLVNKLFGVEEGNRILVGVADILREECGPEEVYGRFRDDRFVLLVRKEKYREERFLEPLQRVRQLVESPIFTVRVQMGVYEITNPELPISTMLDHADLALASIRESRDEPIAWFKPSLMERKLKDHSIVADFEQALKDHEFQIYLQPQVRHDGRVYGAEALVRWVRGNGTVVPPMEFLGVLHQSDLLSHLDAYVWEQAARQLALWKDTEFEDLYISVNVDPSDFYYFDVPGLLADLCRQYDIPTEKLRVEITETALVDDVERQSRIVDRLHEQGFLVEIDDFGKGSSSLSMLKDIHADVLKIDMGFLQSKINLHRSRIILKSVIRMAENLKMDVITEGVETRKQVDSLKEMGCGGFQGFYFSRPIPVADFETVVRELRG